MKTKDVMVKEVAKVGSSTLVDNAVKTMNRNDIGCLIVEDTEEARGIITQKDLLERFWKDARA